MSSKLAFIIFILTISYFGYSEAQDKCTAEGYYCTDCWNSLFCIDLGGGEFLEQETPCPSGTICSNSTGQCKAGGYYECDAPNVEFKCYSAGIFPDPFSCNKYHICSVDEANEAESNLPDMKAVDYVHENKTCLPNYSFDSYTGRCSKRLEPWMSCASKVPICNSTSLMRPLENPHYFYRCVSEGGRLLPEVYSCPNNFLFNVTGCADPSPIVADSNGNCLTVGRFYHPTDCNKYRNCATVGAKPTETACASNNKFDPIKKTCVPITCSNYST